jgi:hypothetical protein
MKECEFHTCKLQIAIAFDSPSFTLLSDTAMRSGALGQAHQLGVQQRIHSRERDRKITNHSGTLARVIWVKIFLHVGTLWS